MKECVRCGREMREGADICVECREEERREWIRGEEEDRVNRGMAEGMRYIWKKPRVEGEEVKQFSKNL